MQETVDHKLKLIVHIGAGKTGSSSIQATMRDSRQRLAQHGVAYLGMMLEYADPIMYGWQFAGGSDLFFARADSEDASDEVYQILHTCLGKLESSGFSTAVWSNEWMFGRHQNVLPALVRLNNKGWKVEILCYVRRHDSWVRSAYVQWGIKHKTYTGPMRSYPEWRKGRKFDFFVPIDPWYESFGEQCHVRNFDSAGDIVTHFLNEVSPSLRDLPTVRENESPDIAALAAWVVFNSRFTEQVGSEVFSRVARPSGILDKTIRLPRIQEMLPTSDDLRKVMDEYLEDRVKINNLLLVQGQPLLGENAEVSKVSVADDWQLTVLLLRMVFSLQEQVFLLRKRIDEHASRAGDNALETGK